MERLANCLQVVLHSIALISSTWEPLEHLKSASQLLQEFEKQYGLTHTSSKVKYERIRELVGGTTTSWIGEPIKSDKSRKYYQELKRGQEKFQVGDYVHTLDPADETDSTYIAAQIESMYSDRSEKKYIKLRWYLCSIYFF